MEYGQAPHPIAPSSPPLELRRSRQIIALWVGLGIVTALLIVACAAIVVMWWQVAQRPTTLQRSEAPDGNAIVSVDESDISSVVQKVAPSVVSIVTTKEQGGRLLRRGAGTGVVVSADGYVMTNKHVVDGAETIRVITSDGDEHSDVRLVGNDPLNDIAFLKIRGAAHLRPATLGDSGTVRVGQRVIAIGNSLGQYKNTVTSGIVSGKGRPLQAVRDSSGRVQDGLVDLLQTDAAINPGNSGGPLLNLSGQVIGINTAIVSQAQSVGFAIPINATKGLVRSVVAHGEVKKSYIGVRYLTITPEVRAEYGLEQRQGALVEGRDDSVIERGGPADKAGLRKGDIITKLNDKQVGDQGSLSSLVGEFLPGERVELTIVRSGREQKVTLTLEAHRS